MSQVSLFLGAFLDALIGPNLIVPGEPFLIAAGYQLHQGSYLAVFSVLLGGFLGDQLSYQIGKKYGRKGSKKLINWQPKLRRTMAKCRLLMVKKGNYVLLFARLLGPVAWVVPFMAGTNGIRWRRFTVYSSIGLILGVGQFIVWGYLLSYGVDNVAALSKVKTFLLAHQYSLLALFAAGLFLYVGIKYKYRNIALKSFSIFLLGMLSANYNYFFWSADDFQPSSNNATISLQTEQISFKAYPSPSINDDAQAINVIFIGASPAPLMNRLGWIENKTFSRHDIGWTDYIALLMANTPPVSDLFWQDQPQQLAYQLPGNLLHRSHIRWWNAGIDATSNQPIWLGAISYDNGLKITPYLGMLTILHSIDPDVDEQRDKLAMQIKTSITTHFSELVAIGHPIPPSQQLDYFTDGHILVINDTPTSLALSQ